MPDFHISRRQLIYFAGGVTLLAAMLPLMNLVQSKSVWDYTVRVELLDFDYSPDASLVAIAANENVWNKTIHFPSRFRTRIYDAAGRQLLLDLPGGGMSTAFSADGGYFATPRVVHEDFTDGVQGKIAIQPIVEIWETHNWTLTSTLELPTIDRQSLPTIEDLQFDRWGNLYARFDGGCCESPGSIPLVWWKNGGNWRHLAESLDARNYRYARSISIVSFDDDVRIAIPANGIDILRLRRKRDGTYDFRLEYSLPVYEGETLQLSPDGRFLATLGHEQFRLFRLQSESGELVVSEDDVQPEDKYFFGPAPAPVFSADGRFLAYCRVLRENGELSYGWDIHDLSDGTFATRIATGGNLHAMPTGDFLQFTSDRTLVHSLPKENPSASTLGIVTKEAR